MPLSLPQLRAALRLGMRRHQPCKHRGRLQPRPVTESGVVSGVGTDWARLDLRHGADISLRNASGPGQHRGRDGFVHIEENTRTPTKKRPPPARRCFLRRLPVRRRCRLREAGVVVWWQAHETLTCGGKRMWCGKRMRQWQFDTDALVCRLTVHGTLPPRSGGGDCGRLRDSSTVDTERKNCWEPGTTPSVCMVDTRRMPAQTLKSSQVKSSTDPRL